MLRAAAASGRALRCSCAASGRSARACGCPRRRRRRRGRRAGTTASAARGRAALALRSPERNAGYRGDPARSRRPRSEPSGGFRTRRSRPGTGYSAALRDSTHLAPVGARALDARAGRAVKRVQAPRPGKGDRRRRRAYCCFARRPACLCANATRRARTKTGEPPEGIEPPLRELESRVIPLDQSGCEVEDTGGRVSVHATL